MTKLEDVIIYLTMHGSDRGALVRHGTPGVLVLLTSAAAVRRDRVAAHCTANGAPCSLDPDKAAPGYEITERERR
jgi:hypothetical protein